MAVGAGAQSFTTRDTSWQSRGACTTIVDPSIMFPDKGASAPKVAAARHVCEGCPVERRCLEYAVTTNQRYGVWGATTDEERRWLRREWRSTGSIPSRGAVPSRLQRRPSSR